MENANNAIFLYDVENGTSHQATSSFYEDSYPVFSADGKYLFYLTNRSLSANYSDMDGTWIYPNSTQIASLSLTKDTPSLLKPKNDEFKKEEKKEKEDDDEKDEKGDKEEKKTEEDTPEVIIDFDNLEARLVLLPPKAANIAALMPFKDK